jgi:hypothetical protein
MREVSTAIMYVDTLRVNTHISWQKGWTPEPLNTVLRIHRCKSGWFITTNKGNKDGFLWHCLLLFWLQSKDNYHNEMDADKFKKHFCEQVLLNCPKGTVPVMDNYSVQRNKCLAEAPRICEMAGWLHHTSNLEISLTCRNSPMSTLTHTLIPTVYNCWKLLSKEGYISLGSYPIIATLIQYKWYGNMLRMVPGEGTLHQLNT